MEAGIFRPGKRMVIPAPANACAAIKSRPAPTNSGPGSGNVWPANHNHRQLSSQGRSSNCSVINESTRPLTGLGSGESSMRVASLESVLTAATLVSAIVIVLWAIKIFYGA